MAVLLLAACDPAHPFVDLKITILAPGNGTARMHVDARARRRGDGTTVTPVRPAMAAALASSLHLGTPGQATEVSEPERGSVEEVALADVPSTQVAIDVDDLLQAAKRYGYDESASFFVSFCVPQRRGRASGSGVEIRHFESCAVWERFAGESLAPGSMSVRFRHRAPAWLPYAIVVACAFVTGLISIIVFVRGHSARRTLAMSIVVVSAIAAGIAGLVSWWLAVTVGWFATSQSFDTSIDRGLRLTGMFALLATASLAVLAPVMADRARRRRVPPTPGPWGPPGSATDH